MILANLRPGASVAVVCACAVGVGLACLQEAATGHVLLGLLLLAVMLLLPWLLASPTATAVMLAVAEAADLSDVAALHGIPSFHLVALGIGIGTCIAAILRGAIRPSWSPVFSAGLVVLAAQCVAALAAQDPSRSWPVVTETAKALIFLVVITLLLTSRDVTPRTVIGAFVATLAVLSLLTALQQFVLGNGDNLAGFANVPLGPDVGGLTARHAGPQQDVNFWGRVLVLGVPLALSLAVGAPRRRRPWWLLGAVSILLGIYLTQSRGALLAVAVAVVTWALLAGRRYRRLLLAAPLALVLVLAVPGVGSRLSTLSAFSSSSVAAPDPSLEGRVAAQEVGLRIAEENPVLGVGPGNFESAEPAYLRQMGLTTQVIAPHDLYLQVTAEGGLVGLATWLLFLGAAAFVAARALVVGRRERHRALPVGVVAALVGWAAASVFLHLASFRALMVVIACGAALDVVASRSMAHHREETPPPAGSGASADGDRAVRRRSSVRLAAALALGVGVLAVAASSPFVWQERWQAEGKMQLLLKGELSQQVGRHTPVPGAYPLSTLSRESLVRTYATVAVDRARTASVVPRPVNDVDPPQTEVSIAPPSTVITVTSTSSNAGSAVEAVDRTTSSVSGSLNAMNRLYELDRLPGAPDVRPMVTVQPVHAAALVLAALALAWAVSAPGFLRPPRSTAARTPSSPRGTAQAQERHPPA